MKTVITAISVEMELTVYEDDGEVKGRRPFKFVEFESSIPPEVKAYLLTKVGE